MKSSHRCRGMALLWLAVVLMVLIGFVGLACDTAHVFLARQKLQIAADAAALAAVQWAADGDLDVARAAAIDIASANKAGTVAVQVADNPTNDPSGDIVFGHFDRQTRTFLPTVDQVNAVTVRCRRTSASAGGPLPLIFGPAFGFSTANVASKATAMFGGLGVGLLVLHPHGPRVLNIQSNMFIDLPGGPIHVNSDDSIAFYIRVSLDADTNAPAVKVVGGAFLFGNTNFDPVLSTGQEIFPDPLVSLPALAWDEAQDLGAVSQAAGTSQLSPGYYSGGISASGGDLELEPGVYVLDGAGLQLTGDAALTAPGILFYIIGGSVVLDTTGDVTMTASDDKQDTYWGVSIFQARDHAATASIHSDVNLRLGGTLYFPSAHLNVNVVGSNGTVGNQIIVGTMEIRDEGSFTIDYDGRFAHPGGKVFLVR